MGYLEFIELKKRTMALYSKSDMKYTDYKWTAYSDDDPKIKGYPDYTKFDRNEGHEVLYLINALADEWSFQNTASCLIMEKMIREKLPSNIIIQVYVKEWIRLYWNS